MQHRRHFSSAMLISSRCQVIQLFPTVSFRRVLSRPIPFVNHWPNVNENEAENAQADNLIQLSSRNLQMTWGHEG